MSCDESAKEYLRKHNVGEIVEQMLKYLTDRRFTDPLQGILAFTQREIVQQHLQLGIRKQSQLEHNMGLDIYDNTPVNKSAIGVIGTIGPISQAVEELETLIKSGLTVVRMNCSHGDHTFHGKTITNARIAAKNLNKHVAIALDTKGPEIRTGFIKDGGNLDLPHDHKLRLTTDPAFLNEGCLEKLYVDYANITKVMEVGQQVYIDDGLLALKIEEIGADYLDTVVVNPSVISGKRGVNLPHVKVDLPAVSEKDKSDLKFAAEQGLDMIFASFIRKAEQVEEVRAVLRQHTDKPIKIISKIENYEGVDNFDEILAASDGIMVARGDLGTEIPIEKVFMAQKMMASKCNAAGKPCIVATQMLESMINNPRPTRAEATDVANAVLDGADLIMLSGETAKGAFRKECVQMMKKISLEAQTTAREEAMFDSIKALRPLPIPTAESIACAAVSSAYELNAAAIVALTNSGATAELVCKYRPPCPVFAVSKVEQTARQLLLHRFCRPIYCANAEESREGRVQIALKEIVESGLGKVGDAVILVHATPDVAAGQGFANQYRVVLLK
eukprot:TRINITY_DN5391_c0_g1_i1.p1 TRINITY_DN5391_c0_g1~~TRINITY_DN5391_c0_g1_i1.p1  ORF type:complete len:559 (+),score=252.17 TRINITY_DN5391_c0_g1_i1:56-1732(+)